MTARSMVTACAIVLCFRSLHAENWPGWRGPQQNGISSEINLPLYWSETENVHWKIALPGEGHSSPIVWDNALFVTVAIADDLTRRLLRIDRESGKIVWNRVIATAPIETMHRDNSSASSTPITDGKLVYVSFCVDGKILVAAITFDGELAWQNFPGTFASEHGYCTGLVIDETRLLLSGLQDGEDAFVAALNKETGETMWKVKRDYQIRSFSTPYLCDIDQQPGMLLSGAEQTVAYNRITGREIFKFQGPASKTVSSIVACPEDQLAFVCGGRDNQFVAVKLCIEGENTNLATPQNADSRIAWRANKAIPYMTSPLASHGLLHVLSDEGVYSCFRAKDGKLLQQRRAVGPVKASMVATQDRIYINEVSGRTTVIANDSSWTVLATNEIEGEVVASPAISNGDIVLRTRDSLLLIRGDLKTGD